MGSYVVLVDPYYVLSTIILNDTSLYIVDTLTVDGSWGPWRIGQCSVTCGVGTIVRTRECNNPPPATGGKDCVGVSSEIQSCYEEYCPGTKLHMYICTFVTLSYVATYFR